MLKRAKIVKNVFTDILGNELKINEIVTILDDSFDLKVLVITKEGFKKLINKDCLELLED